MRKPHNFSTGVEKMNTTPRSPLRTPYNTGKVKIGIHYVPPMFNRNTEATDFWQAVYSGEHAARRRERLWMGLYVAALAVGFVVGYWLLRGV